MCQRDAKFLAGLHRGRVKPLVAGLASALLAAACASGPTAPAEPAVDPAVFSADRAWQHLQALSDIGPRQTGTRGAARARDYLREQLEALGATVQELAVDLPPAAEGGQPLRLTHLVGLVPGESSDRFMLAASYDTRAIEGVEFVGANASASGPAVVLELGRALSRRPLPYGLMLLFLDGDALPATKAGQGFPGSRSLAAQLAAGDAGFSSIRLAVFFQQVGDIDLTIARDLRSHHVYRDFFWQAAATVGRGIYFPADAGVESVDGGHLEFIERGLPRAVLISDPRFGGDDVPGRYAASAQDTPERCSADSLAVVGEVTLEALDRIAARLARIDRFRESPLVDPLPPSGAAPASQRADPPGQAPVAEDPSAPEPGI